MIYSDPVTHSSSSDFMHRVIEIVLESVRNGKTTHRANVDSLVNVSKLTLPYAASQLNTIALNLIVPC